MQQHSNYPMRSRLNTLIQNPTFNSIGILICLMHVVSWYIIFHNNHYRKDLIEHSKIGALASLFLIMSHGIVVLLLSAKQSKTSLFRGLVYASFLITLIGVILKIVNEMNGQDPSFSSGNLTILFGSASFNLFLILDSFFSNRKLMFYGGISLIAILLYPIVMMYSKGLINYERLLFMLPSVYLIYLLLQAKKSILGDETDILD